MNEVSHTGLLHNVCAIILHFSIFCTSLLHPSLFHNNLYPVGVSSVGHGEHSGTQASVVHSTDCSAVCWDMCWGRLGLPPGVFNIVTGTGSFGSLLATHPLVDKVGFTGSTEVRYEVWVQGLILCLGLEISTVVWAHRLVPHVGLDSEWPRYTD